MSDAAGADLEDVLARLVETLRDAGIESAEADAELILAHVLRESRGRVRALALLGSRLEPEQVAAIDAVAERRRAREPLQHITGTAAFRGLELAVGPGVFVPRFETELVAQFAIDAATAAAGPEPVVVDLGSGSGAIALAVATEVRHASVYAVEGHEDAFAWTQRNVDRVGARNARAVFADLTDALPELDGTVSVVVSNPPYIPDDAIPRDAEVRLFDPATALYGGPDGLDPMRAVSRTARRLLHPGGTLIVEHGDVQGEAVRQLLTADGWNAVSTHRDLTLRDRAATALR